MGKKQQKEVTVALAARKLLAFTAEVVEACDYGHEEYAEIARDLRKALREAVNRVRAGEAAVKLTKKQQEHVLRDFMQWSGGYLPHEVPWTKREAGEGNPAVNTYLRLGAPADLPRAGLRAFLLKRHRDLPPTNNKEK